MYVHCTRRVLGAAVVGSKSLSTSALTNSTYWYLVGCDVFVVIVIIIIIIISSSSSSSILC